MVDISVQQYNLVTNMLSFTIAVMGAGSIFFFAQRSEVLAKYRASITILGIVTAVATYNYFRLYQSWTSSFSVNNGVVRFSGIPYNDTLRYADWLLTVPLLLVALVLVLDMPTRQARLRSIVMGLLAAEMIVLGYPGQISTDPEARWIWWGVAMVPFLIIIVQLYGGMRQSVNAQATETRKLIAGARFLTVLTWSAYPVIYVLPLVGITGSIAFISTEVGYAVADMLAKVAYGVMIYLAAAGKSVPDLERTHVPAAMPRAAGAKTLA